ncbi:MAG: SUMF1/EgtB/PvdO family nonheme iron enzyme [Thermodesulfobacteriota bacterium]
MTIGTDANQRNMKQAIRRFGKQLRKGGVGLFYFAGHGIQVKGSNYLIPIGAEIETEPDVEYEAVDAGRVLAQMEDAGNSLNVIILDACRDNPFGRSFRTGNRGLAKMDAPTGSILSYATAPGSVASDGPGRNGLYTSALLKHMSTPGLEIGKLFRQVRIDVLSSSGEKQVPWEASSLTGDFYFNTQRGIAVASKQPVTRHSKKITNSLGMEFVYIPPGTFMMGSAISPSAVEKRYGGKAIWYKDEHPQHRVALTNGFYMQATEVTQGQWKAVMGSNPSRFKGNDLPVERVSWVNAQEFIRKLNQREGGDKYRLPTEAEWEYACRAGSTAPFYFGSDKSRLGEYAWYWNNSGQKTHATAQKKPNAWGLYDMQGNVYEWCQDWYGDYPSGSVTDHKGPSGGSNRVKRGGSWLNLPGLVRSANRFGYDPALRPVSLGFRLLRAN